MQNVNLPNSAPCSGCGACAAVCPKGAVQLGLEDAGFYRASVREDLCVDCGLCLQVCHRFAVHSDGVSLYDAKLYALQSADAATVKRSSSGGIAQELTRSALEQGAGVIGSVYNLDTNRAEHRIASDMVRAQLVGRRQGSKIKHLRCLNSLLLHLCSLQHHVCPRIAIERKITVSVCHRMNKGQRCMYLLVHDQISGINARRFNGFL